MSRSSINSSDRRQASSNNNSINSAPFGFTEQIISVTDLISEGPIGGLVKGGDSIYLNNDPIFSEEEIGYVSEGDTDVISGSGTTAGPLSNSRDLSLYGGGFLFVEDILSFSNLSVVEFSQTGFSLSVVLGGFSSLPPSWTKNIDTRINSENLSDRKSICRLNLGGDFEYSETYIIDLDYTNAQVTLGLKGFAFTFQNLAENLSDLSASLSIGTFFEIASVSGAYATLVNSLPVSFTNKKYALTKPGVEAANIADLKKYSSSAYQFRPGTLNQEPIQSLRGSAGTTTINLASGVPLELGISQSVTTQGITGAQASEIDLVDLVFRYPSGLYLTNTQKGGREAAGAGYLIEIGIDRDDGNGFQFEKLKGNLLLDSKLHAELSQNWTTNGISGSFPASVNDYIFAHGGKNTSAVSYSHTINLEPYQPFGNFQIKVTRLTNSANSTGDNKGRGHRWPGLTWRGPDVDKWQSVQSGALSQVLGVIKEKLNYPYSAVGHVTFNAKQFSSMPTRTYECYGMKVRIPSNYSPTTQTSFDTKYSLDSLYSGIWDGDWKRNSSGEVELTYTHNPAWVFYDILVNNRYGLGAFLEEQDIDKYSLYKIARYCDEPVPNGKGGWEPRFTANLYLTKATDAYKVLKDMATIFRGMLYWADGTLFPVIDEKKAPVYNFSRANVEDGKFNYEGTGSKTRVNQVIVTWNNPESDYKLEPILVEDRENIIKTGKIIKENAVAFGCTSQGQAIRYGRWKLWTAVNQTEIVSFKTAINAAFLAPGDIINVEDSHDFSIRNSGRISSASTQGGVTEVVLDSELTTIQGTQTFSVVVPKISLTLSQETEWNGYKRGDSIPLAQLGLNSSSSESEIRTAIAEADASIQYNNSTTIINSDITAINGNTIVLDRDLSSEIDSYADMTGQIWAVKIDNDGPVLSSYKEYKIMSIQEDSDNAYSIVAVEYYESKFDVIDNDFTLALPEPSEPSVELPTVTNAYILRTPKYDTPGEEFILTWELPDSQYVVGVEIEHNVPSIPSPVSVNVTDTSYNFTGVSDGEYTFYLRTRSSLGKTSKPFKVVAEITDYFGGPSERLYGMIKGGLASHAIGLQVTEDPELGSSYINLYYALNPLEESLVVANTNNIEATLTTIDFPTFVLDRLGSRLDSFSGIGTFPIAAWDPTEYYEPVTLQSYPVNFAVAATHNGNLYYALQNHSGIEPGTEEGEKYWYLTNKKDDFIYLSTGENYTWVEPDLGQEPPFETVLFTELARVSDTVYIMADLSNSTPYLRAVNYNSKYDIWYDVGLIPWPYTPPGYIFSDLTNDIVQLSPFGGLWTPKGGTGDTVTGENGSNILFANAPAVNFTAGTYSVEVTNTVFIESKAYKVAYVTQKAIYLDKPLDLEGNTYTGPLWVDRLNVDFNRDFLVGKVTNDTFISYMTVDPALSLGAREVILDSDTPFITFDRSEEGSLIPTEDTPTTINFSAQAIGFDDPIYELSYSINGMAFNQELPTTPQQPNNGSRYDTIVHLDLQGGTASSLLADGPTKISVVVTESYAIGDVTKRAQGTFTFIPISNGAFGEDGRVARLDAEDYSIVYDAVGQNPQFNNNTADSDIDLTVTTNVSTPLFRFTNASGGSDWTENNTNFFNVPENMSTVFGDTGGSVVISVEVAIMPEGWVLGQEVPAENIVAGDSVSIIAVYAGSDAISVSMPNDSHSISCNNEGIPFVNVGEDPHTTPAPGSGTSIEVFQGATNFLYTEAASPEEGFFRVDILSNSDIIAGGISSSFVGQAIPVVSDHVFLSSSEDNELLEYIITIGIPGPGSVASVKQIRKYQTFSKAKGGTLGSSSSLVYLYKASVGKPAEYENEAGALPVEVDMSTGSIILDTSPTPTKYSQGLGGWYTDVNLVDLTADGVLTSRKQVWIIGATANSTSATDLIQPPEFTSPIQFSGTDGLNTATVELFIRTSTETGGVPDVPPVPSGTTQYNFSTGVLSGDLQGWSQQTFEPNAENPYIWRTSAAAISNADAAAVASDDWSEPKNIYSFVTGSNGENARAVKLTSEDYSIVYTPTGSGGFTPSPAGSVTLTAIAQNFNEPLYKITGGGDGVTVGVLDDATYESTNNTASFVIPTDPADWAVNPYTVRVSVAEAVEPNTEVAFDTISIFKVAEGADGEDGIDGYTVIVTNSAHTIPSDFNGNNADYTGSGTSIEVYRGATQLTYGTGADTFSVSTPVATNITFGGVVSTTNGIYTTADHSAMLEDTASIEYPLVIEDVSLGSVKQTFSLSKAGQTGQSTNVVFKRVAVTDTAPTTPDPSIGVPSGEGWFDNPPDEETDGSTQLWASSGVKAVGASTFTWQTPYIVQSVNAVEVYAYREGSDVRNDTGSYNFTTNTLTPPTGWDLNPPTSISSGATVWVIAGTATGTPGATAAPITWGDAVEYLKRQDGTSTNIIFRRSATNPGTPTTDTNGDGIPDNWFDSPPTGTDLLWASAGTYNPDTDAWTWGAPYQAEGTAVAEVAQYRLNSSDGGTTGGSYNFTTSTLTTSSADWSINPPGLANNGDVVYVVVGTAAGSPRATAAPITWGTPVVFATRVDGQPGEGDPGVRGPRIVTGYIYYSTAQSTAPTVPAASNLSIDWGTGVVTAPSGWSISPPTFEAGTTNTYWYYTYTMTESGTYTAATDSYSSTDKVLNPTAGSNAVKGIGFQNLVTFTSLTTPDSTQIDGSNIYTGRISSQGTQYTEGNDYTSAGSFFDLTNGTIRTQYFYSDAQGAGFTSAALLGQQTVAQVQQTVADAEAAAQQAATAASGSEAAAQQSAAAASGSEEAAQQAAAAATLAAQQASGKAAVYRAASPPSATGKNVGDIWIETDNNNKPYIWNGSAWQASQDANALAASFADNIQLASGTIGLSGATGGGISISAQTNTITISESDGQTSATRVILGKLT